MISATPLRELDPEIHSAIAAELARQQSHIELIASENFTHPAVMEAQGSILTNKYAEGYPGRRYYAGCGPADTIEQIAIDRAKRLFGAEHANVQPHSGSQANFAVYTAMLQPGDKILGMTLSHGGHLTHGNPANFSGKLYHFCQYGVREDNGLIDYDELAAVAAREKPRMITVGASAYSSPTSPGSWPPGSIPRRSPTPISSRPRPTRRCAAPAAASSCARRSTPRPSTRPSFREAREAPSCT